MAYILVDSLRWGDIGVQGSTTSTLRIDALAAQGRCLANFNVQNHCTSTRSAILTGRLAVAHRQALQVIELTLATFTGSASNTEC